MTRCPRTRCPLFAGRYPDPQLHAEADITVAVDGGERIFHDDVAVPRVCSVR